MSQLVDQFGYAVSSRQFFDASRNGGNRPATPTRPLDPLRRLLTYQDWKTISFLSDKLFANNGVVKGAVCHKAMLSVGNSWKPVFHGEDKEWGKLATQWLLDLWYPTCDVRGSTFDFVTGLFLDSIIMDRAGDAILMLTYSEDQTWPMIQRIPTRQIGQWTIPENDIVKDGPYIGAKIRNGVILNSKGRPIAYRLLGEKEGEFTDIPAANIIHVYEPEWCDQNRGLPIFSASIEEFRDIAQSDEWERKAMMIASSIGLIEYNDTGSDEDPNDPVNALSRTAGTVTDGSDLQVKTFEGGLYRYLKAGKGHKLEQFTNSRPGDDWEKFNDRQIRKGLAGANWPYSMAWKPEGGNGTITRSELNKAKTSVSDRQSLLRTPARRAVGYAVSVAIKSGWLPEYKGSDLGGFLKWGFTMPPQISIDEGRDRKERREDYRMGLLNASDIIAQDGDKTLEDHYMQRAHDIVTRKQAAAKVSSDTGIPIEDREMQMLTPNEMSAEDTDSDSSEDLEKIQEAKARMDAYGVGVRAGAITPNDDDENSFRESLELPPMNNNVRSAWTEDGGVRRPITLVTKDGESGPSFNQTEEEQ